MTPPLPSSAVSLWRDACGDFEAHEPRQPFGPTHAMYLALPRAEMERVLTALRNSLSDWEEIAPDECEAGDDDFCDVPLCRQIGCLRMKVDEARAALSPDGRQA